MEFFPAIIIPSFSRPKALNRLLTSINTGKYPTNKIRLVISLDGNAAPNVVKVAEKFSYSHGFKEIIYHKENLGLRKHIVWCGDLTKNYGSIILLEDDLLVDKFYYIFAQKALNFYYNDKQVAGIALYSPCRNEYVNLPFEPMQNGSSSYPMQIPCSWGQAWTYAQWRKFRSWYEGANNNDVKSLPGLPDAVKAWPESSWKKYFATYLVREKLNFIYPYISYTTNCSDVGGTHYRTGSNVNQVALSSPSRKALEKTTFLMSQQSPVSYDSFFEPCSNTLKKEFPIFADTQLEIDLYATKSKEHLLKKKYTITTRPVKTAIATFNLIYKPIELNLYHNKNLVDNESSIKAHLAESKSVLNCKDTTVRIKLAGFYSNIEILYLKRIFQNECNEIFYSSLSWKITKPLRALSAFFNYCKRLFSTHKD